MNATTQVRAPFTPPAPVAVVGTTPRPVAVPRQAPPPAPAPLATPAVAREPSRLVAWVEARREAFRLRRLARRNQREYDQYCGLFADHPGMQRELETLWRRAGD